MLFGDCFREQFDIIALHLTNDDLWLAEIVFRLPSLSLIVYGGNMAGGEPSLKVSDPPILAGPWFVVVGNQQDKERRAVMPYTFSVTF